MRAGAAFGFLVTEKRSGMLDGPSRYVDALLGLPSVVAVLTLFDLARDVGTRSRDVVGDKFDDLLKVIEQLLVKG